MDGLLVVNKPAGPTSHDVVARTRRALAERRIGHTGTLDPMASGVLPLLLGRATRLAQFLTGAKKSYRALVRFGIQTDSFDMMGQAVGTRQSGPYPSEVEIDRALDRFRGAFLQQPPAFSAKKINGRRSYRLARSSELSPVLPAPARVTAHSIVIVERRDDTVLLVVECSAGFYVRSLAHDLGQALGVGAHLAGLERTSSGAFGLETAMALDEVEAHPAAVRDRLVPLADILPEFSSLVLTAEGVRKATQGRTLGPSEGVVAAEQASAPAVRLLDEHGDLVGIAATLTPGLLHPSVILM